METNSAIRKTIKIVTKVNTRLTVFLLDCFAENKLADEFFQRNSEDKAGRHARKLRSAQMHRDRIAKAISQCRDERYHKIIDCK